MPLPHLFSEVRSIAMAAEHRHSLLRGRLVAALVLSLVVDAIGTVVAYAAERGAKGSGIRTLGAALFWTSAQLTTVSSPMPNPVTTVGRVLDIGLEAYAVVVVTALAGSFSAFLHHRSLPAPISGA